MKDKINFLYTIFVSRTDAGTKNLLIESYIKEYINNSHWQLVWNEGANKTLILM